MAVNQSCTILATRATALLTYSHAALILDPADYETGCGATART